MGCSESWEHQDCPHPLELSLSPARHERRRSTDRQCPQGKPRQRTCRRFFFLNDFARCQTSCIEPYLLDRNKRGEIAQGLVYNVINKKYPSWDERRVFRSPISIAKPFLYTGPERLQISLVPRSPRFGLNRIGPERFVVEEWRKNTRLGGGLYRDMWFDGNTPEDSHSIIVCGSDERADGTLDPENGPYHMCEHTFTVEKLTARVKLSYRKGYLKDWREIRTRADALLSSFLID